MNRLLAAFAVLSLAVPGTAAASAKAKKPSPRAKVYRATLSPTSSSAYGAIRGKAQMVDNKKRDSAKIQLKGLLAPGATYSWVIYRVVGDGPACDPASMGEGVQAFRYKPLVVNAAGNASATAKSRTFSGSTTSRYGVAVRDAAGNVVSCGELKRKKAARKKPSRGKRPAS